MILKTQNSLRGTPLNILLTALVSLSVFSTDIYLPSLPEMIEVFYTTLSDVQFTLSSYMVGFAISMLFCGAISDRYGRRPVVLFGIGLHFVSSLVCLFAPTIEVLIAARFFQALGGCCGTVLGRVIVRDLYPQNKCVKVISYMATGMSLSPALAPMFGGYLQTWFGWKASFITLACVSGTIFLICYFFLSESISSINKEALNPKKLISNYGKVLGNRNFLGYTAAITFAWCGYFSFICGSSFVFIDLLKVSPSTFGMLYGIVVTGYLIGTFVSARFASRFKIKQSVLIGAIFAFTGSTILLGCAIYTECSIITIMVPMVVFLIGIGIIMPNCQVAATAPFPHLIGSAASLFYFIEMMMGAGAGTLVGKSNEISQMPMVLVNFGSSVLLMISFLGLIWIKINSAETKFVETA
ncbi:MAG: multidrug effflux MFS transporter [Parachlamydiales bacterium]|nr:multidrug effflux MFS transporter [Parachlamydiales bacterium]